MAVKPALDHPAGLRDTCSEAEMAALLGISPRAVREWANKGILNKVGKGRYETVSSLHAYIQSLRETAAGHATTSGRTLADEKAELTRIERQTKELRLAQLKGDVLTLEEVAESWTKFAQMVRGSVLSLPSKARSTIPHLTAHDGETLKRVTRDMLSELARDAAAIVVGGDDRRLKHD